MLSKARLFWVAGFMFMFFCWSAGRLDDVATGFFLATSIIFLLVGICCIGKKKTEYSEGSSKT